jgi:predicted Zn finger-like uncharacterized protein
VRIRCERCATTYELDEKRLPPHGALVKCTRCDHVFRAAPPAPDADAAASQDAPGAAAPAGDERTALFGFSTPGAEEQTASIAAVKPPAPAPPRRQVAPSSGAASPARRGRTAAPGAGGKRPLWPWVLLAAILAALALAAGWYAAQSRVATPTTRLPAVAELLPT